VATDHEISRGRDITWTLRAKPGPELITQACNGTGWIMEIAASGTRAGKPLKSTHLFQSSLHTNRKPCCNWCGTAGATASQTPGGYEGGHWIRDTQLHEDAHRYRGNGVGAMATLRTAALNLLRLAGYESIRAGIQADMQDITALLAMVKRQPKPSHSETLNQPCRHFCHRERGQCRGATINPWHSWLR